MKRMQIFKTGTHTSANGVTLEFSEDMVKQAVAAYDPALYEAPIVVGHPKDNHPAYGWIAGVYFSDGAIEAEPHQLDPEFEEMVKAGRFKNRSASFYHPDNPNNPKPGVYYLRHVGFLGAQPPAVKGLKAVEFSESEGVVEFSEPIGSKPSLIARLMALVSDYSDTDTGGAGGNDNQGNPDTGGANDNQNQGDNQVTIDELKAQLADAQTKLATAQAEKDSLQAKLDATTTEYSEFKAKAREAEINGIVDGLVKQGKLTPAQKGMAVGLFKSMDANASVEYGEGDNKTIKTPTEAVLELLSAKQAVNFGEAGGDDGNGADGKFDIVGMAIEYQEAQAAKGISVTTTEAVNHIKKQQAVG